LPNPATGGQNVTVTASGLKPATSYLIAIEEPPSYLNSYSTGSTTNATGAATWTGPAALTGAGTYIINWYSSTREAIHNQPEASCSWLAQ
jgi:hypothetical protein